ncbi:hypothetical protein [Paraburkholderia youngii]|uniref:hypothetical protein n=1 Tax=Paraburkholderia youngii TaxID=2782701 RepID=UPI003D1D4557
MYALTTHSTSANLAWNERAIEGSDTATTFVSSTINAHVAAAVASTDPAERGGTTEPFAAIAAAPGAVTIAVVLIPASFDINVCFIVETCSG